MGGEAVVGAVAVAEKQIINEASSGRFAAAAAAAPMMMIIMMMAFG